MEWDHARVHGLLLRHLSSPASHSNQQDKPNLHLVSWNAIAYACCGSNLYKIAWFFHEL